MEPESEVEIGSEQEPVKPKNFFARLGGVYSSPRSAFTEIGRSPGIWLPSIVLMGISLLVGFYVMRNIDLESMMASRLQDAVRQGSMTKEQMEQQMAIMPVIAKIQLIASPLFSLLYALAIAGYAKLFSTIMGGESRFKHLFCVTAYALIAVSIVQSGLMILVLQMKGFSEVDLSGLTSAVASSLGAIISSFMGADVLPKMVQGLANAIDVFAIWTIALLAIGYSTVSRKLKTSTAAAWLGIAWVIIALAMAYLGPIFNAGG